MQQGQRLSFSDEKKASSGQIRGVDPSSGRRFQFRPTGQLYISGGLLHLIRLDPLWLYLHVLFPLMPQILDEIGVDMAVAAPRAGAKKVAGKQQQSAAEEDEEQQADMDALTSRLANLKS